MALTDHELVELWVSGDYLAARTLFGRHFATVFRYLRSRTHGAVDDLIQQTFLGCLEARDRYRREASFQTFLLGIARHKLLVHLQRTRSDEQIDSGFRDPRSSPSQSLAKRETERLLWTALEHLPEELRHVIDLTYFDGLDGPSIARTLGLPLNTVYSRIHRAKLVLKRLIAEPGPFALSRKECKT